MALIPNVNELRVSSECFIAGPMFTINAVLQLPPNASYSILVNLESLNGTKVVLESVKACIHLPNAVNE